MPRAEIRLDFLFQVKPQLVFGFGVDRATATEPAHVGSESSQHVWILS